MTSSFPKTESELTAVNRILASVGQAPVTSLETTNPDVAIAFDTLTQVSKEVQAEGWSFNTDINIKHPTNIHPDTLTKHAVVLDDWLQADLSDVSANINKKAVIRRGPGTNFVTELSIHTNGSSGGTNQTLTNLTPKNKPGNNGSHLTVDLVISGNVATEAKVKSAGEGYKINDLVEIPAAEATTADNVQLKVTGVNTMYRSLLYDNLNHTFDWDVDELSLDVIKYMNWVDLPPPIQNYVTAKASTLVSARIVGDAQQYRILQQSEALARSVAIEYECNQGDYSYFGTPPGTTNNYISYQPYKALYR